MQASSTTNVVWLAEQCHLLEKKNLDLRKELRDATEKCHHYAAEADKFRTLSEELQQTVMHLKVRSSGTNKMEDSLRAEIEKLKGRIKFLEQQKREITRDRAAESRILDRVCEKHAKLEESIKYEAERHAEEEGKYLRTLEDFKDVTEREAGNLKLELQRRNMQIEQMRQTIQTLEGEMIRTRKDLMDVTERFSDVTEREQTLVLEREMLQNQLEEMQAAYRKDLSEARAQAAGTGALEARLMDTQGLLREAEAELSELRQQVAETLSREGALVGKIMVARNEATQAMNAKMKAERLSQQQHVATLDLQLKLDRHMEEAVAKAAKQAVADAVRELTGPSGVLRSSRTLKAVSSKLSNAANAAAKSNKSGGGLLSRMQTQAQASSARILSAAAQASAKASAEAAPVVDFGFDEGEEDLPEEVEDDGPLAKTLKRDRSTAKQTIAQHLLHKAFDVMETEGVRAATMARRIAMSGGNDTVAHTSKGVTADSFMSTGGVADHQPSFRDHIEAKTDEKEGVDKLLDVPSRMLFARTTAPNDVRLMSKQGTGTQQQSYSTNTQVKVFALTPMRQSNTASTAAHGDVSGAASQHITTNKQQSRRPSVAVSPDEAMQRLHSMGPSSSPLTLRAAGGDRVRRPHSQASQGRVWDVSGGGMSRPMFSAGAAKQ